MHAFLKLSTAVMLLACGTAVAFGEDREPGTRPGLFSRSRRSAEPLRQVVLQPGDVQPMPTPSDASALIAPMPQPAVPEPLSRTPFVNCSDVDGPIAPIPYPSGPVRRHFSAPKPAVYCEACGSFRCDLRFAWGSCRAFFDEGRFTPQYPQNCPCAR